ncbi:MAG TPA: hypothetical protein DDW51_21330 [Cyanobacteria bacterium UBA11367]|nr:hypothetical protein [Cyanobacteria bacterium UBA11367]
MNLKQYFENYERIASLARRTGIHDVSLVHWRDGKRPVPIPRCTQLEVATGGLVTRKDLRPGDWWKIWPELSFLQNRKRASIK